MAFRKTEAQRAQQSGPALCSWNDYGDTCTERGILSQNTNGSMWYCRAHFYRLMRWHGMEGRHGNELPEEVTGSKAVDEIRARLKAA